MLDRVTGYILRGVAIACLVALFLLIFVNVGARTFQLASFPWFDEVIQGLFAWMVFIGSAALWREQDHFRVGWLADVLPDRPGRVLAIVVVLLEAAFLIAMTRYGWDLTVRSRALTPILNLPTGLLYASIPAAGAIMLIYTARDFYRAAIGRDPIERMPF
ncbi:TRAP transporter small permease [Pseudooceanicola sp. C21-150M6]